MNYFQEHSHVLLGLVVMWQTLGCTNENDIKEELHCAAENLMLSKT